MAHVALHAQERTQFGNGPTRRLRREGMVPGVVYQPGDDSLPFALSGRDLRRALNEGARFSVIDLHIGTGGSRPVLLKDWQVHPVRGDVLHVDFVEVDLTQQVEYPVSIVLLNTPVGVREGGVLDQPVREVTVRALPDALPESIEQDVEPVEIGGSVTVGDLTEPPGVTIVDDPEIVVASVVAPTELTPEEEEGPIEELGEGEAGEEAEGGGEPEAG